MELIFTICAKCLILHQTLKFYKTSTTIRNACILIDKRGKILLQILNKDFYAFSNV